MLALALKMGPGWIKGWVSFSPLQFIVEYFSILYCAEQRTWQILYTGFIEQVGSPDTRPVAVESLEFALLNQHLLTHPVFNV